MRRYRQVRPGLRTDWNLRQRLFVSGTVGGLSRSRQVSVAVLTALVPSLPPRNHCQAPKPPISLIPLAKLDADELWSICYGWGCGMRRWRRKMLRPLRSMPADAVAQFEVAT